jgi:ribosomal protein L37AE/L43A
MPRCDICEKDKPVVHRTAPKGQKGMWACNKCHPTLLNAEPINKDSQEIANMIVNSKPNTK